MRNSKRISIDEILSISDFIEDTQIDMNIINEAIDEINRLMTVLINGGYMKQDELEKFMQKNPITDVYSFMSGQIKSYELPPELYRLVPRPIYDYTIEILKNKLNTILKQQLNKKES